MDSMSSLSKSEESGEQEQQFLEEVHRGERTGLAKDIRRSVCKAVRGAVHEAVREELAAALPPLLKEHVLGQVRCELMAAVNAGRQAGSQRGVSCGDGRQCGDTGDGSGDARQRPVSSGRQSAQSRSRVRCHSMVAPPPASPTIVKPEANSKSPKRRTCRSTAKTMPPIQLPGALAGAFAGLEGQDSDADVFCDAMTRMPSSTDPRRSISCSGEDKRAKFGQGRGSMLTFPSYFQPVHIENIDEGILAAAWSTSAPLGEPAEPEEAADSTSDAQPVSRALSLSVPCIKDHLTGNCSSNRSRRRKASHASHASHASYTNGGSSSKSNEGTSVGGTSIGEDAAPPAQVCPRAVAAAAAAAAAAFGAQASSQEENTLKVRPVSSRRCKSAGARQKLPALNSHSPTASDRVSAKRRRSVPASAQRIRTASESESSAVPESGPERSASSHSTSSQSQSSSSILSMVSLGQKALPGARRKESTLSISSRAQFFYRIGHWIGSSTNSNPNEMDETKKKTLVVESARLALPEDASSACHNTEVTSIDPETFFANNRKCHQSSSSLFCKGSNCRQSSSSLWCRSSDGSTMQTRSGLPTPVANQCVRRKAVIIPPATVHELALAQPETRRWPTMHWPFLSPDGFFRKCWDAVGFVCFALQLIYLPFRNAFMSRTDLETAFFAVTETLVALMDLFWLVDVALNFITGFYNSKRALETDSRAVALHYLKGWFLIDCLATVPGVLYQLLRWRDGHQGWLLTLMFLFRVLRVGKLARQSQQLEAHLKSWHASSVLALGKLIFLPIVVSHCAACALWAMGRMNLEEDPLAPSWIKEGLTLTSETDALANIPLHDRYVCAMYFSVTVMSTVGLGDIAAVLPNERSLLMVVMISTSIVIGVAVNGVSQFINRLGERTTEKNERLTKVARFMKWYQVPPDLQSRVHTYLQQFFENKDREDVKFGLMEWIKKSDLLRSELNLALTGKCLAEHRLMAEIPSDLLVEICDFCEMIFHPPGDIIESPGCEVSRCLYIRVGYAHLSDSPGTLGGESARRGTSLSTSGAVRPMRTSSGRAMMDLVSDGGEEPDPLQEEMGKVDLARPGGVYGPGSFLSDKGLFLGGTQTQRTITSTSFTELIALDYKSFRSQMNDRNPLLLHMLSVYTCIELDCPSMLLHHLEEWEQHVDEMLLHAEAALHDCAKRNAAKCAALLTSMHADVEVLDADDKSPAHLAAALKHVEVFTVLVLNGAIVSDVAVLTPSELEVETQNAATLGKSGTNSCDSGAGVGSDLSILPSKALFPSGSAGSVYTVDTSKEGFEKLRRYAELHDLKLERHGHDGTKGLEDLFKELKNAMSTIERTKRGRLRRRVFVVRLRLIAIINDEVRSLLEMEPSHWLRSPDTKVARLPSNRVSGGNIHQANEDLVTRLGLRSSFYDRHMAYISTTTTGETKQSMTYPGLETEYVYITTTMRIRKSGMVEGTAIGLPNGSGFQVMEETEHLTTRKRTYFWSLLTSIRADSNHRVLQMPRSSSFRTSQVTRLSQGQGKGGFLNNFAGRLKLRQDSRGA